MLCLVMIAVESNWCVCQEEISGGNKANGHGEGAQLCFFKA